jgi:hypothetical protein
MSLIRKGTNQRMYESVVQTVAKQLLKGRCVFFLGAGASIDATQRSLPTGRKLSQDLARDCKLDWHDYIPLSTIAFYYESFFTRQGLNDKLVEAIEPPPADESSDEPSIPPSSTVKRLVEVIQILESRERETLVVTTNYDRHFERAYHDRLRRWPDVVVYRGGWNPNDRGAKLHVTPDGNPAPGGPNWMPSKPTSLYKMHGCISQVNGQSLVITEEDYINFLTNALGEYPDNRLLYYVRGRLEVSVILFLGYSLSDWNFRTIFKATVERREKKDTRSYAVQLHAPQTEGERDLLEVVTNFWHDKAVDIVSVAANEFVCDLLAAVQAEVGQGGAHAD